MKKQLCANVKQKVLGLSRSKLLARSPLKIFKPLFKQTSL